MIQGKILIVDDNKSVLNSLKLYLDDKFILIDTLLNSNQIPDFINQTEYNVVLLDMNFKSGVMTGNEGLFWLKEILKTDPTIAIITMTAYGDIELAVNALKEGATDFVEKPWDNKKLLIKLENAYKQCISKRKLEKAEAANKYYLENIQQKHYEVIGSSVAFNEIMGIVKKVSVTDVNILITGENGSGKEMVAYEIHRRSNRKNEALVNVDMGSIVETLFESELFGHVKGAFTDAKTNKTGRFEMASKGTLFLDEIGNLSLPMQSKLLSVIQNKCITPVGSTKEIPIDIRLICATNKDLQAMVKEGTFREDLLYRINTIQIKNPALRERVEDIDLLSTFYLNKYKTKYGKHNLNINSSALQKLKNYHWPGNIRELKHTIEKAVILSDNNILTANNFYFHNDGNANILNKPITLYEGEIYLISKALKKHNGNISKTATELGIQRQTLYAKMKKYDL